MTDATFTIRCETAADLPAIQAITAQVFEPVSLEGRIARALGPEAAGPGWLALKMDVIAAEIRNLPDGCFVAIANGPASAGRKAESVGGQVVAYVTNTINPLASRGYISSLAVAGGNHNRGIGRALVEHSLAMFRARGLRQAKIDTIDCNVVGQHLYPALGFKEAARVINYVMNL